MNLLTVFAAFALLQDPPQPPKSGKFRGEVFDPATKEAIMKVRMQIPEPPKDGRTWGFLFVCHGFRGHENNSYLDGAVAALKRLGLDQDYLVIAGKAKGDGWTQEDDGRFLKLFDWAKKTYPVDPRRLFLFGSSNGAAFVCRFGMERQDIVAGVVSYCGGFNFSKMPEAKNAADRKTEWYFVHGGNDRPQNSQRACDELRKRGYRYVFRKIDGYGHTDIWDAKGHPDASVVDSVRDDWAAWIHALRHKELAAPEEPKDLASAVRVGGPGGAKLVRSALASPEASMRVQACEAASKAVFGRETVAAVAKLVEDSSPEVRVAAIRALGVSANWRFDEAQKALADLATRAGTPLEDRRRALDELAKVVRLPLLGNFEDKGPFAALSALLGDAQDPVREAALTALEKAVFQTFETRPPAAAEDRAATAAKWKDWIASRLAP